MLHAEVRRLTKRYDGVHALREVDWTIRRGEIHALVGENGAGKSTLGRILAGAIGYDSGELLLDGAPVRFRAPRDALAAGVALVHQEIALVPTLSVLENVFLAARPTGALQRRALRRRLQTLMHQTGFVVSQVDAPVSSLRIAEQQKVEILRALVRGADMIVMDEPTAALSDDEAERLYALIRSLRDQGTSVVYISHYLEEVLALADTVSVLKDGQLVRSAPASGETPETLIAAMLGRSLEATFPDKTPPAADAPVVLSVTGVTRPGVLDEIGRASCREGVSSGGVVGGGE